MPLRAEILKSCSTEGRRLKIGNLTFINDNLTYTAPVQKNAQVRADVVKKFRLQCCEMGNMFIVCTISNKGINLSTFFPLDFGYFFQVNEENMVIERQEINI